ncbi:tigger transposable element-derived protein 1-like [Macrobrachium nipponense]|uniref:tigger transposable element-derived protein 1-like n=1 Tax=Macrobrachium nipponense TaxID=159736 RepID=UPI0030C87FCB
MAPMKTSGSASTGKRRMMSLEIKLEIVEKHEQGMRVKELAKHYNCTTSTICTILKQKESLKKIKPAKGVKIISKHRTDVHEKMENLLHGEAASADVKAAEEFVKTFAEFVEAEGYIPQQIFNCDETGLFWKMPRRTYITEEEKKMPGHKPMKDRLTLALCANASGDCKIKPLLVYHSENPRAFKAHKVMKEKLHVMWRANPKAWVTRQFFIDWVNLVFGPLVKKYLKDNNLPLRALLVLDNAPAHPPQIEEEILDEYNFVKVLYFPPNTTPYPPANGPTGNIKFQETLHQAPVSQLL